jgi:hypothetical protein
MATPCHTPMPEMPNIHLAHNLVSVPGNFHVSTHSADAQPDDPDMSHVINSLVMGDESMTGKSVSLSMRLKDSSPLLSERI